MTQWLVVLNKNDASLFVTCVSLFECTDLDSDHCNKPKVVTKTTLPEDTNTNLIL